MNNRDDLICIGGGETECYFEDVDTKEQYLPYSFEDKNGIFHVELVPSVEKNPNKYLTSKGYKNITDVKIIKNITEAGIEILKYLVMSNEELEGYFPDDYFSLIN